MSNKPGTKASREEEIAFLAMEQVLAVDIRLADAGAGNKKPDGFWIYLDNERLGIVEITAPPATNLMSAWAAAKREERPQSESGSIPPRLGALAKVCNELLAEGWAKDNLDKLLGEPADERHLLLFGRSYAREHYFFRLSDSYEDGRTEHVENLVLSEGISDVWFRGRARRDPNSLLQGSTDLWLARFQASSGWHHYKVSIEEQQLPSPNPCIAEDRVPKHWRQSKDRNRTR
ncbi:hypothetical protein [Pseudoclavibacter helvolus]|uniref:hypothetical protein n=1 Tax=Pseudoclavibacter helvolus TaxID=255205 RepID=UPI003C770C42